MKIVEKPPCDSFATFRDKNPYVHTKNPARVLDTFDHEALEECKGTKNLGNL